MHNAAIPLQNKEAHMGPHLILTEIGTPMLIPIIVGNQS
jgi:hypothetical protein